MATTTALPEGVNQFDTIVLTINGTVLSMIESITGDGDATEAINRKPLSSEEARLISPDGEFRIILAVPISSYEEALREEAEFDLVHALTLGFGNTAGGYLSIRGTVGRIHVIEYGTNLDAALVPQRLVEGEHGGTAS